MYSVGQNEHGIEAPVPTARSIPINVFGALNAGPWKRDVKVGNVVGDVCFGLSREAGNVRRTDKVDQPEGNGKVHG